MRKKRRVNLLFLLSFFILLCFSLIASAQENENFRILLKSGVFTPEKNISPARINQINGRIGAINEKSFLILQFGKIPSESEKQKMLKDGIRLLEYIPALSYICEITDPLSQEVFKNHNVRAVIIPETAQKTDPRLAVSFNNNTGEEEVLISFYRSINYDNSVEILKTHGFTVKSDEFRGYNIVQLRLPISRLTELASFPFVQYIEKAPPPLSELNLNSRNLSRTNLLQTTLPAGYNLTGEGVVVGVAEITGAPQPHIDFADRLIPGMVSPPNGYHSTHVNGILGGAGLINELYKGYASKANLYATTVFGIGSSAPIYFQSYGMVLTNNSYATGGPCVNYPTTILQTLYDQQAINFPALQNVFAGGNSGDMSCSRYPYGYNTIEGSQTSAKSVIAVGNTMMNGELQMHSSRGPTSDGRIKPDITATGTSVISTIPVNGYGFNTGTSMASPAAVGGLALMYQRYKQLHNEQNPPAALMKAILCNTANDAGNTGPDFNYGFGSINLYRAVKAIDGNQYFADSVTNLSVKTKSISVAEGGAQLKILLYWQDPAASIMSSRSLVNDLDITVTGPSGAIYLPYRLDTTAANVGNPATRGEDHVNNVEQVVIDLPQAGNYIINIRGTEIGQNPQQEFYVTYDQLPNDIMLTFPFGNEALVPNENITIQWDSWGAGNSTFQLEFSPDNGATWQMVSNAIASDKRQFDWQLPIIPMSNAQIKLTRNADSKTSVSGKFTIVGVPIISFGVDQCPGNISLQWNSVPGASWYEIMRVSSGEMVNVDTTSSIRYTIRNLSADSVYWVTVRSVINNKSGRRAIALSRKPDTGNCTGNIFDNDLEADTLIAPLTGRKFTSTQLSATQRIIIRIKNLDDQPANNFKVSYSVNGSNWVSENVTAIIAAGSTYIHSSTAVYDFSQPAQYTVKVAVKNNLPDLYTNNDTLQYVVRYFDNLPVDLSIPVIENFDQAADTIYTNSFPGLKGVDKFDYKKNNGAVTRIRFPLNEQSDTSGRSLKFDLTHFDFINSIDQSVIGTYNFAAFDTAVNSIGLSFTYSSAPNCTGCADEIKLFVRGNDTLPWIQSPSFNSASGLFSNRKIQGIELSNILAAAGQNFSSAFQLKLTTNGNIRYLFDDITLYNSANDVAIASIDSIGFRGCNLGTVPLRVTIRNTSKNAVTNVQVNYKIDNGATITETITSIPANTSKPYTFATVANLTAPGYHTIETWVNHPNDPYISNNLKKITVRNQPVVNSFPYLENFENSAGSFYTDGNNSSWEYGRPSATLIKQPASGNAAWKTNLDGKHNNDELSYLYSPCIDYSGLQNPVVSISLALNIDSCITPTLYCDYMRAQYSTDGTNWIFFPFAGFRYNWPAVWTTKNYYRWHVATQYLPATLTRIQFRFLFSANHNVNYEGAAIDDFHIYDMKTPIYDSIHPGVSLVRPITGSNTWTEFIHNQKIIASINPYGQNPGNVTLTPYIKPIKPVADFHGQYYLNRSFTITAENKNLADSIGVRLYYLDSEVDSLLFAGNCIKCSKPGDAYRFGISQYSTDSLSEENDNIPDNINGSWSFIENRKIKIVPFGKGYYAEFKVKDLSEFRLNSGGTDKQSYLPVNLLSFSATKSGNSTTDVAWTVASEININRYEIEVAKGNEAYATSQFVLLGQSVSPGSTAQSRSYSYADASPNKNGVLYYRLKIIDEFGNYSYSRAIPVFYSKEFTWKIFPNPSNGVFFLQYQLPNAEKGIMNIYNSLGQTVRSQNITGNGYVQTMGIDMSNLPFQRDMYLIKITTSNSSEVFKLILQ